MTARFLGWFAAAQLVWACLFAAAPWWWVLLPTGLLLGAWCVLFVVVGFDLRQERIAARRFERWRERSVK